MIKKLQKLGLSEKESFIYSALAMEGQETANKLAKKTSSNRTVTYNILQQLVEKGLVTYVKKQGKRYFTIAKPESLLADVKEKESLTKEVIHDIKNLPPNIKGSSSGVEVYEGIEGMKSVFNEIRKAKQLRVLNATGRIFDYLRFSAKHIVKEIESHLDVKVIANESTKSMELTKYRKIKFKYLPKGYENNATTFIFNNKVIIQDLTNKPFLIRIENKEIYEGYAKDFNLLWKLLKK